MKYKKITDISKKNIMKDSWRHLKEILNKNTLFLPSLKKIF